MTELIFDGIEPRKKYLRIGIQGNHKVDKLVFVLSAEQADVNLFDYKPFLKVANKTLTYADILSEFDYESNTEKKEIRITLTLIDAITQNESVDMQLMFKDASNEEDSAKWQTKYFNVAFDEDIPVEHAIARQYPNVIKQLEKRIDEVEQIAEEKAESVIQMKSYLEFPNIGNVGCLYIDSTAHTAYHWDEVNKKYFKVVSDDLDLINILDANGGND